jgi:hypothetical protein
MSNTVPISLSVALREATELADYHRNRALILGERLEQAYQRIEALEKEVASLTPPEPPDDDPDQDPEWEES